MKLTQLLGSEVLPQKIESTPGKGCRCAAYGECECVCGVDWTDHTSRNEAISSLQKVELVINEEDLLNVIAKYHVELGLRMVADKGKNEKISPSRELAKTLIQSQRLFLSLRRSE